MGGFDKMALGAGPEAIKAYMQTLVPLVERGGYIPFCDHRCPPNVKPEDYLYYLDLKEEMFGLANGAAPVNSGLLRVSPGYSPAG
jgi:uroporphyrinogen decarboxylase